jgi:soluble lytic murein transglycosylase-like protein
MDESLVQLAKQAAQKYGLDPALVCAVCEQESSWNPWAVRYEPRFEARYIIPLSLKDPTEAQLRAFSFGLMQLMGEVARELGFHGPILQLTEPEVSVVLGCQHLANKLKEAGGDVTKALLLWNGGADANYPVEVQARVAKYTDPVVSKT